MRPLASLLLAAVFTPALSAQGWIVPRPCPECPPPPCLGRCPWVGSPIVRTASDVKVELADRVLRYEIDETFTNRGPALGEADYYFPLPTGAAFQDLKLAINGEFVAGETMDAGKARQIYEEIVRRQRDPALVEWMGSGLLHTRIFPIAPREERRVVVRFQAVAQREGDALRIDYVRGARGTVRDDASDGERSFTLTIPDDAGYGEPYSPTHTLRTRTTGGRRVIEARGDGSQVTILLPIRARTTPAISVLANAPGNEPGFALITLSPPAVMPHATPRDVTFVLDVSGSMSGTKMDQARAAGKALLATLHRTDRFRFIDFSTDVRTFRDTFALATPEAVRAAQRYLDDLDAGGSTNIIDAVREALAPSRESSDQDAPRLRLVLFVTDGAPTVGERDPATIARYAAEHRGDQRVFTFGLGADVNAPLLEQLALEGHGTAQFVRPDESVERAVSLVASRLTDPVVTDLRVSTDGDVRLSKVLPSGPIDLFAGQDLVVLTRYTGSGHVRLRFDGRSSTGEVHWSDDVELPDRERGNAFIPRLWATQRIGWLSADKRQHGGSAEIDDEIRELGERYGIPTEFTSYLVQEPNAIAMNRDFPRDDRRQPPPPMPASERAFNAAKAAAGQREAMSLSAVDSVTRLGQVTVAGLGGATAVTRAGDHLFARDGERWVDVRYHDGLTVVRIKAYSAGYFSLLSAMPELRAPFALGERVLVAGRRVAIEVTPEGAGQLGASEMQSIRAGW